MNYEPDDWKITEEDVKMRHITPAIQQKWPNDKIRMEAKITDGKINARGNTVVRNKPMKADYLLFLRPNYPIAVVEAKNSNHEAGYGIQQAMNYARKLDVPFAYSSNGQEFLEHDLLTGKERKISMDNFPSMEELSTRYKTEANLTAKQIDVIETSYFSSQNTYSPRYYQRIAINRTLDAIARGQNRLLLVMATGTGKTYTAFQIVWRLLRSGVKRKVLYLADRNVLVDQTIQQDFAPLAKTVHKINVASEDKSTITSHEVYFSLYQQLVGDDNVEHYSELFSPDFFDLIIVDECHRGSAKEDSRWKQILEYFSSATQIGMTATPKETQYASNVSYFGDPIYTYSLKDGIEDGFLAPFKVINIKTDIGDGWRPTKGQRDYFGNEIEDRVYTNSDYDYNIVIEDRINQVAAEITKYLRATDPMSKTIVFCPTEDAAERMRQALVNCNPDTVRQNPDYVVRITGNDNYGKSKLDYFISVSEPYPVIATTSKLLSTGVDCKMVKLIVLDEMINSMTEFKQIIGRGTRLREKDGKTNFTVMDFRNVTKLFNDPDWDGPIEIDPDYKVGANVDDKELLVASPATQPTGLGEATNRVKPVVTADGCAVKIIDRKVFIYDTDNKLIRQDNIDDYAKELIVEQYPTIDDFVVRWMSETNKQAIRDELKDSGIDITALKLAQGLTDIDDFDFICNIAYKKPALTRALRAKNVINSDFLDKYNDMAKTVLQTILRLYSENKIENICDTDILKLEPFHQFGKPTKIAANFGDRDGYLNAVRELQNLIYADRMEQ